MEGDNDEKEEREEKPRWRSRLTIKIGGKVSASLREQHARRFSWGVRAEG
jgi:hypothetical protein